MSIGDVNSNARGSGARYNDGKARVDYIPARVIANHYVNVLRDDAGYDAGSDIDRAISILYGIAAFEEGSHVGLHQALADCGEHRWAGAGAQFDFGAKKYAAWNWAKGMQWSVPLACAKRHLIEILEGESNDRESGVHHFGAVACNLIMLSHFVDHYKEGDDRPPSTCFSKGVQIEEPFTFHEHGPDLNQQIDDALDAIPALVARALNDDSDE